MAYWRMNTDKNARNDAKTYELWYEHEMAFTGDSQGIDGDHAEVFKRLSLNDGIFMHHNGLGIVGYGTVEEEWDWTQHEGRDKKLYLDGKAKEKYEYRIKVAWLPEYDSRKKPLNINKLMPYRRTYYEIDEKKYNVKDILAKLCIKPTVTKLPENYSQDAEILYEGTSKEVIRKFYERNPGAREKCLSHWGFDCCICGFNFEVYGSLGKDYIHVHHIVPISSSDNEHPIDPVKDLCPVCPNCHVMLHRKSPPYTIEELRDYYKES